MRKGFTSKVTVKRMLLCLFASLLVLLYGGVKVQAAIPEEIVEKGLTFTEYREDDSYNTYFKVTEFNPSAYTGSSLVIPGVVNTDNNIVEEIGDEVFRNIKFQTVIIRPNTRVIGENAFSGAVNLKSLSIPYTVKTIGPGAFLGCTSLKEVLIPDSVETIDKHAFGYSTDNDVILDFTIIGIPGSAAETYALENNFTFKSQYTYDEAEDGTLIIKEATGYSEDLILPSDVNGKKVSAIEDKVFANSELYSVVLSEYCKTIGEEAFASSKYLKYVYLPYGLTTIGKKAFYDCSIVRNVVVPNTVQTIGEYALGYINDSGNPKATPGFQIYGISGSAAHQYAQDHELNYQESLVYSYDSENGYSIMKNLGWNWYDGFPDKINGKPVSVINCMGNAGSQARSIVIPDTVKRIEAMYAPNLEKLELPSSVTYLKQDAFRNTRLKEIVIPKTVTTIDGTEEWSDGLFTLYAGPFRGCKDLKKITLESGIEGIPVAAFAGTDGLEEIEIPDSVTSIGVLALANCPNLKKVYIPESVTSIGKRALGFQAEGEGGGYYNLGQLSGDMTEEEWLKNTSLMKPYEGFTIVGKEGSAAETYAEQNGFTFLGEWVTEELADGTIGLKKYNGNKTDPRIPDSLKGKKVTQIMSGAFVDNTRIESVEIPYDVTVIGNGAFQGCTNLKNIKLSGGLKTIGDNAFSGCEKLETIVIGANVTSIGNHVFDNCYALSEIEVSQENTAYRTVDGVLFDKGMTRLLKYPSQKTETFYVIPSSVTTVDDRAFFHCPALEGVLCYDSVKNIGDHAFGYLWDEDAGRLVQKPAFLIRGVDGSKADQYAKDHGFEFKGIFDYVTLEDGNVQLTKYYGNDSEVQFPAEIAGKKVTSIAGAMCLGDLTIEKLIIPDSVISIGSRAFANCTKLRSVHLGSRVAEMSPSEVFAGCRQLTDFTISEQNQSFSAKDGCLYNKDRSELYLYVKNTANVVIEEGTRTIGRNAFYERESVSNVTLPSTLTLIREGAFFGCKGIKRISIPYSVQVIGDQALGYYRSGSTLIKQDDLVIEGYFGTAGESYAKENGLSFTGKKPGGMCGDCRWEFDANTSTLTISGEGKVAANSANNVSGEPWVTFADRIGKIVIGNGVTEIGTSAFRDLKAVKELVIGKSVDTIGEFAFQGLASLTAVTIPDGVRTIKGWAFGDCSALSSVTLGVNLKKIGDKAFFRCPSLGQVSIPSNVTQIGDEAFGFGTDDVKIAGFKIRGVVGSQAQAYAVENRFTFLAQDAADETKNREQVRFLPEADQKGCSVKLVIRDSEGEYHTYDMSASDIAYGGAAVQTAYVPADLKPTLVQFQIYDGTTLKKTVDLTADQYKAAKGKIVAADGSIFDESKHTPDGGKIANTATVKVAKKTVKRTALAKKAQKVKALTVEKAQGKVTYKIVAKGTNKKLVKKVKINKKGVITIPKMKLKKGSYKIKVQISVAGNATYKKATINKVVTVKIK